MTQSLIILILSKINPLAGISHVKLTKELDNPRKGLINIQNINGNEWLNWCLVGYLNPTDHHPARLTKADKYLTKMLDFKDKKILVKIRGLHKIRKRIPSALALLVMKLKKNIQSMYQNNVMKKTC